VGGMGFEFLILIIGGASLLGLQMLRAMLSATFPKVLARVVNTPAEGDVGGHDLYDAASEQLLAAGFEGPIWIANEYDPVDGSVVKFHAAFRNRDENIVAWLAPPSDFATPNEPMTYFTSAFDNGKYAVSQISDPYFAVVGDELTPAQTIAPTDVETALAQHKIFVSELAGRRRIGGTARREMVHFAGAHQTDIRNRLLAAGRLGEVGGVARPTLSFGVRLLRAYLNRPKVTPKKTEPVPAERLAHLDRLLVAASGRAPSQATQWWLMLFSAVASLGIGWPVFGLEASVVLIGVIAFHEFGHWFAMKLAGYSNPHITLLPLLGGVTIGHETDPSAAKRAWVSLAGPLPGIILGWALIFYASTAELGDVAAEWLTMTATMLLIINYLNALPIPPLDGSHVVRALLPPKWVVLHVLFVLAGTVMGIYVAYLLEFWLLAIIATTQLISVRSIWSSGKMIRQFRKEGPPAGTEESQRLQWIYRQDKNPAALKAAAAKRIAAAREVLNQADLRPMGWGQGLLVTIVFFALIVVPVAGIALVADGLGDLDSESSALYTAIDERTAEQLRIANSMPIEELLADLQLDVIPGPASVAEIAAANERLGQVLPNSVTDFYSSHNGLPDLGISPLSEIDRVRNNPNLFEAVGYLVYEDTIQIYSEDDFFDVAIDEVAGWLALGSTPDHYSIVLLTPAHSTTLEPNSIVRITDSLASVYPDVAAMLRDDWVSNTMLDISDELHRDAFDNELARLADREIEALLDELPKPSWIQRMLPSVESLREPAGEQELLALEARVGRTLPADYRYALAALTGSYSLLLLPTGEIVSASVLDDETLGDFLNAVRSVDTGNSLAGELTLDSLRSCWVIGGYSYDYNSNDNLSITPSLLWCPHHDEANRYIRARRYAMHPTFTSLVRTTVAQIKVAY